MLDIIYCDHFSHIRIMYVFKRKNKRRRWLQGPAELRPRGLGEWMSDKQATKCDVILHYCVNSL